MTLDIYYLFNLIGLKQFAAINFRLQKNLKSYTLEYSFWIIYIHYLPTKLLMSSVIDATLDMIVFYVNKCFLDF